MKSDNNTIYKDKKGAEIKKSSEEVETPTPPQHMDPSKKPAKGSEHNNGKKDKK